jgi:hypothetical protein
MKWHRLFGLALTDFFTDTAYRVELEKDLSLKQQFLDVVIIEQESGKPLAEVPDGLDNLAKHNLLTYKSLRQTLNSWALDELVGHYVNYRKQISPSLKKLLPAEDFRLYAATTRFPRKLARQMSFKAFQTGVFEVSWGSQVIRIIVLSRIPPERRNALWELFSAIPEKVRLGASQYRVRQQQGSTMFYQLYHQYQVEGIAMPYTWEDFQRDFKKEFLAGLTAEDLLQRFSKEDLLQRFSKEDLLQRFSKEDLLERLSKEDLLERLSEEDLLQRFSKEGLLQRLSKEDRLKGLSTEEIEAYLKKLRQRKN